MALHMKKLINDTVVNVAQLLKEPVGATRMVSLEIDALDLDDQYQAGQTESVVRLTRLETGILAEGTVSGLANVDCVRCLEPFAQHFSGEFDAEYRPSIDVRTGDPLPVPEDDEILVVDNNHELDLAELLRQMVLLTLPMRPICSEDCPGIELGDSEEAEEGDERLAVLEQLLNDSQPRE